MVTGGSPINGLRKVMTGASTGVGQAGIEMELLDSQTGTRLAAAVDAQAGSKLSNTSKWQGAVDACDYWALRMKTRLSELRSQ